MFFPFLSSDTTGRRWRPANIMAAYCEACVYFRNDPAGLEKAFPGLVAMGSAFASVTAQDGLCTGHGLYLSARDTCKSFSPAHEAPGAG